MIKKVEERIAALATRANVAERHERLAAERHQEGSWSKLLKCVNNGSLLEQQKESARAEAERNHSRAQPSDDRMIDVGEEGLQQALAPSLFDDLASAAERKRVDSRRAGTMTTEELFPSAVELSGSIFAGSSDLLPFPPPQTSPPCHCGPWQSF
jgi:hypothetical protein